MYKIKNNQFSGVLISVFLLFSLISCSSAQKSGSQASSKPAPAMSMNMGGMSMDMNMKLVVLFKKNTSYLAIHELNDKLPDHTHEVLKSKKLFKYTFPNHKNYMSGKDILTAAAIVDAVSKYQASESQ